MTAALPYAQCLTLVDDRSAALREAVAAAPDLQARVPGCPEWTIVDLVTHLGNVQRWWAVVVRSGPSEKAPPFEEGTDSSDLLAWSAESTRLLIEALTEVGPEAECWTWWPGSDAPQNAAAVARHQVQEAAVHAYDAQAAAHAFDPQEAAAHAFDSQEAAAHAFDAREAAGRPEALPAAVAVDGVAEFLQVTYGAEGAWPHRPARVIFACSEGPSWTLDLTPAGAHVDPAAGGAPVATVRGSASDILLALFGRVPLETLRIDGDVTVVEQLQAWGDTA